MIQGESSAQDVEDEKKQGTEGGSEEEKKALKRI